MRTVIIICSILVLLASGFLLYVSDYYHADRSAIRLIENSPGYSTSDNLTILKPEKPDGPGLIFYPGGKVEHTAYLPLLDRLRQAGVTCVLVSMPFRLAVFDTDAADRVFDQVPEVTDWYIGGHSLGGAMAGQYYATRRDRLTGLILLGSYIYGDVRTDEALTIYGSEDQVLNRSKITYSQNVYELEGGNHAYFGNYGEQKGDGKATLSREEQQTLTVKYILTFMHIETN